MGLSPTLLDYAENIWRRFPEAFISLGLPHLEEMFVLNEGSWCCRVVDTKCSKIVEIVLPRRPEGELESDDASVEDDEAVDVSVEDASVRDASVFASLHNEDEQGEAVADDVPLPTSARAARGGDADGAAATRLSEPSADARAYGGTGEVCRSTEVDLSARLVMLNQEVNKLRGSIGQQVMREVEAMLDRERLSRKLAQDRMQENHAAARGQGQVQSPAVISQPGSSGESSPSNGAASSLASRRGVSISAFDTASLRRYASGGADVMRVPHLDRYNDTYRSGGAVSGISSTFEEAFNYSPAPTPPSDMEDPEDSPGTLIQRRAARRRRLGGIVDDPQGGGSLPSGAGSLTAEASLPAGGSSMPSRGSGGPGRGGGPSGRGAALSGDSLLSSLGGEYAERTSFPFSNDSLDMSEQSISGTACFGMPGNDRGSAVRRHSSVGFENSGGEAIYDDGGGNEQECSSPVKRRSSRESSSPSEPGLDSSVLAESQRASECSSPTRRRRGRGS